MPGARGPVRVTPKAIGVLRALARQSGQVVTRQALLAEVWTETLPTDDVLTQAVTQLRKAFGSGSAGSKAGRSYIETIAKSGYRLKQPVAVDIEQPTVPAHIAFLPTDAVEIAPEQQTPSPRSEVEGADDPPDEAASPVVIEADAALDTSVVAGNRRDASASMPAPRSAWARASALTTGMFLALGVVALLVWGAWSIGAPNAPTAYRLITSNQGEKSSPALSPDGQRIAYSAARKDGRGSQILIQPARNAPAKPLLAGGVPGLRDGSPVWSPDGRDIAFIRRQDGGRCAVLVAAVDMPDTPRMALACDGTEKVGIDWLPDGTGLVLGALDESRYGPGLHVLDLASGVVRPIAYATVPGVVDHSPRVSPDGRWILFGRNPQFGDLWRIPVDGGSAERLTDLSADLRGWSWVGSDAVVFGRRVDAEVRLYRLDLATRVMTDVGLDDAQAPATSAGQNMLAFVRRQPQFGLFKVMVRAEGGVDQKRIFASSGRDNMPVVSPDGGRLAFASDRAGPYELWLAELDVTDAVPVPVEGLVLEGSHPPTWSSDGQRVLVAGLAPGEADAMTTALYEVDATRRRAVPLDLPVRQVLQGGYTDDGALLVVARDGSNGLQLIRFEPNASAAWRQGAAISDVSQFRYDAAGHRVLFTRLSGDGLWQVDDSLREASLKQLDARRPARPDYRSWAMTGGNAVGFLSETPHCASRLETVPLVKAERVSGPVVCLSEDRPATSSGFSIDPESGALYLAMAVEDGAEIGLMAAPSSPATATEGVLRVVKQLILLRKSNS